MRRFAKTICRRVRSMARNYQPALAAPRRFRAPVKTRTACRPNPIRVRLGERRRRTDMRIAAIVLLAAGILALVYGGFTYTKETHEAKVGPLDFSIAEKERVNIPVWAGVAF